MGVNDLIREGWVSCPECGGDVEWDEDTDMWVTRLECVDCDEMISWRAG